MVVSGSRSSSNNAALIDALNSMKLLLEQIYSTRDVHFGLVAPNGESQEGDLWYNPETDRFRVYVDP